MERGWTESAPAIRFNGKKYPINSKVKGPWVREGDNNSSLSVRHCFDMNTEWLLIGDGNSTRLYG